MAKTTFYEVAAYLADGREGSAKIPGETPGMGKHGTCVCVCDSSPSVEGKLRSHRPAKLGTRNN